MLYPTIRSIFSWNPNAKAFLYPGWATSMDVNFNDYYNPVKGINHETELPVQWGSGIAVDSRLLICNVLRYVILTFKKTFYLYRKWVHQITFARSVQNISQEMVTQMSIARRGIATEEMVQVAKDEDVDLGFLAMTRETGKRLPVYDR